VPITLGVVFCACPLVFFHLLNGPLCLLKANLKAYVTQSPKNICVDFNLRDKKNGKYEETK